MKTKSPSACRSSTHRTSAPARGWRVWVGWAWWRCLSSNLASPSGRPPTRPSPSRSSRSFRSSSMAACQPMDSLGRNSLLQIRNTMSVPLEGNAADGTWGEWSAIRDKGRLSERNWYQFSKHPKKLKPAEWLLEVMTAPDRADDRYIFAANHPDLVSPAQARRQRRGDNRACTITVSTTSRTRSDTLRTEAQRAEQARRLAAVRHSTARCSSLQNAFFLYMRLKNTIQPQNAQDFSAELQDYLDSIEARPRRGHRAAGRTGARRSGAQPAASAHVAELRRDEPNGSAARRSAAHEDRTRMGTHRPGAHGSGARRPLPDSVRLYATMATAYRTGDVARFNETVADYQRHLRSQGLYRRGEEGRARVLLQPPARLQAQHVHLPHGLSAHPRLLVQLHRHLAADRAFGSSASPSSSTPRG